MGQLEIYRKVNFIRIKVVVIFLILFLSCNYNYPATLDGSKFKNVLLQVADDDDYYMELFLQTSDDSIYIQGNFERFGGVLPMYAVHVNHFIRGDTIFNEKYNTKTFLQLTWINENKIKVYQDGETTIYDIYKLDFDIPNILVDIRFFDSGYDKRLRDYFEDKFK